MTTVEILKEMAFTATETQRRALEDAISDLSENKGDLISRQDAIDAVGSMIRRKFGIGGDLAEITLTRLPSVENKRDLIECARTLKKHCINTKDCKECFMWDECKYELSAPCDWDLPDEEKGGE